MLLLIIVSFISLAAANSISAGVLGSTMDENLPQEVAPVVPSIQYPSATDVDNIPVAQIPTFQHSNTGGSSAQGLDTDSVGFIDIMPAEGMSGGPGVDTTCGLLGVTVGPLGLGGTYVKLTAEVVQRIMAVIEGP
jgi:hypothetical protein